MDSQGPITKRLPIILVLTGVGLLFLFAIGSGLVPIGARKDPFKTTHGASRWLLPSFLEIYGHAWHDVQDKVEKLRRADEENAKLRLENAHLKLTLESVQFSCTSQHGNRSTEKMSLKLNHETGSRAGRVLASLTYKVPSRLQPAQLHTLGVSYLKAHEDEKAAVIFTHLTGMEDNDSFRTAKNFLLTGVSWYRVENFQLADTYFDEVLKQAESKEAIPYQAQARLWKALVAKKLNKEIKTQFWLKDLIDHHPHSEEASWVNMSEGQHAESSEH